MAVTVVEGWPLYSGGVDCESFLIGKKKQIMKNMAVKFRLPW